jgi:hypothetical protein
MAAMKFREPGLCRMLEKVPQWQRPTQEWEQVTIGDVSGPGALRKALQERLEKDTCHCCAYIEGMKHQMALSRAVLAEQPEQVMNQFLYEVVKEVVMHEVGHTLGLRHNFKASTIYSLEEIKKRRDSDEPTCGSVMDYNPVLFFAHNPTEGRFITPTLGPYDYWAIEYGYRPYEGDYATKKTAAETKIEPKKPGADPEQGGATGEAAVSVDIPKKLLDQLPPDVRQTIASADFQTLVQTHRAKPAESGPATPAEPVPGEAAMLQKIASRATEPELAYGTDEDATFFSPDPGTALFDMGADPIAWAESRIELINKRMENFLGWSVRDKESWYHARTTFIRLMFEKVLVLDYVGRYIGGQHFNRAHRGDPDAPPPFTLVDAKTQRRALAFIEKHLFGDAFFHVPPDVLNHISPSRWWHDGARVSYSMDFPIHNFIAFLQWWNLFDRLFPNTLRRLHDAELKTVEADSLTVAEYLRRLESACWSNLCDTERAGQGTWSDNKPFVSDIRRSLQREYLGLMEPLVRIQPGFLLSPDLQGMLKHSLRELSERLDAVLKTDKLDFASAAHVRNCKTRIDRMLAPELKEYSPYGY